MSNLTLRKNAFSDTCTPIEYVPNEKLNDMLDRVLVIGGYAVDDTTRNHFQILVNGLKVEKELWTFVTIKETDTVLIAPILSRGEGGQTFKQIAMIAIAVGASAYFGPGGWAAFAAAATTVVGALALNALIPPPAIEGLDGGYGGTLEESQMYAITGQSNVMNKYGVVPKVYGRHRIFPTIAVNPYTEIETDSGLLVQVFRGIYDFGIGPMIVEDLKIGETPLTDFSDFEYRWVDLNRPLVDEGDWDTDVYDSFTLYSGDVEVETLSFNLDRDNGLAGTGESQVVSTASDSAGTDLQQIALDFVCPQGLIAHGTDGTTSTRSVAMQVKFRQVGTSFWYRYNDLTVVNSFSSSGGAITGSVEESMKDLIASGNANISTNYGIFSASPGFGTYYMARLSGGFTHIPVESDMEAYVGDQIYVQNTNPGSAHALCGTIGSIVPHGFNPGLKYLVLSAPSPYQANCWLSVSSTSGWSNADIVYLHGVASYPDRLYRATTVFGGAVITAETTKPHYATFKFNPKFVGHYEVQVTRISSTSTKSYQILDRVTLTSLTTRFLRDPILTDQRHRFLELKIRATNQLSGVIQNLSGVVTSVLDVYDDATDTWVKEPTRNPAWVFADLMTGPINRKAVSKSRLHTDSLLEWAEYCDEVPPDAPDRVYLEPRFQCDFVLDFKATLQSIVNSICGASQAGMNIIDGKYGVLVDKLRTVPVQIFTPRNSSNFSSSRSYDDPPHGLKVTYIDGRGQWSTKEVIVYDEGYDDTNATVFEDISSFACANVEQAYRFGRYMMAQAKLRKEVITIDVDFEYLVCTRGDFVLFTQDVMKVGGTPARVKSIVDNRIVIDDAIELADVPFEYGYTFRADDGQIYTSSFDAVSPDTFDLAPTVNPYPKKGDLIIIGEIGKTTIECIVKSITPSSDLTATLTLIEKADDVYSAESTGTLPEYDPQLFNRPNIDFTPGPVTSLDVLYNTVAVVGGAYQYYIGLIWNPPIGSVYSLFEIYVDTGSGYGLYDFTSVNSFEYIVNHKDLNVLHRFKVLAVSAKGNKIILFEAPEITATPLKKVTPPSNVPDLYINSLGSSLTLTWTEVADLDISKYIIRYSPTPDATWETSTTLALVAVGNNSYSTLARSGTYLIKAQDFNGNRSTSSALAITNVPDMVENVIEEVTEETSFLGSTVQTEVLDESITLEKYTVGSDEIYYLEGYYYCPETVDVGAIATVRIDSTIDAETFSDVSTMEDWTSLAEVLNLSVGTTPLSDTFVDSQVRYRNSDSDPWSSWVSFTVSEITARYMEFRLKLRSDSILVTPRVREYYIGVDVPDRTEYFSNIIIPIGGVYVDYGTPFIGPAPSPSVTVTQDNAQAGDRYEISGKTLSGFTIKFYDNGDAEVERQADIAVRGYGHSI